MDHIELDQFFADRLAADRFPVVSIEISTPSAALRDAVYAGVARMATSHSVRLENGAVDLSRTPVSGIQVLAVGRHSVADIKAAVRSSKSLRAGIVVIDDFSEPELTRFLGHFVDMPAFA
ncbi:hypothetical protein BRM3_10175 [Brachybacterium huguangmaarense]|uniref:Uncharacterized protein n=1 Tax=Brachybacterium huguangmaarense TaxID=1652028 RepID=A0ABY6FYI9_9MICO|nr:hypothetical protein [Brachybacterium huguangmaarense]UYG15998.1 hypothetical protein BRM3_10175 [Brachybacterium huguangmaarense]